MILSSSSLKQPPKPTDVTLDFLKSGTEPFLRSLQKKIDLLNGSYPTRKRVDTIILTVASAVPGLNVRSALRFCLGDLRR